MLTKHLEDCIKYLPQNKWFDIWDLPAHLSRRNWICQRLTEEGVLERKVEWVFENEKGLENRTDFRTNVFYFYKI